jgi:hypothetical protein
MAKVPGGKKETTLNDAKEGLTKKGKNDLQSNK